MLPSSSDTLAAARRLCERLSGRLHAEGVPVDTGWHAAAEPLTWDAVQLADYAPVDPGMRPGSARGGHWFRLVWTVPEAWRDRAVFLEWNPPGAALIREREAPHDALPGGRVSHYCMTPRAEGGEWGQWFAHVPVVDGPAWPARLVVRDEAVWGLWSGLTLALALAEAAPEASSRHQSAVMVLRSVLALARMEDRSTWPGAEAALSALLSRRNGEGQRSLSLLAPVAPASAERGGDEMLHGAARALRAVEQEARVRFLTASPAWLAWLKEEHPGVFHEVSAQVSAGRWVAGGGPWVLPAGRMLSGEAWARQLLWGQRFRRDEWGAVSEEWWVPVPAMLPATLPQLLSASGVKRVWMPGRTAVWEGVDGTRLPVQRLDAAEAGVDGLVRTACAAESMVLVPGEAATREAVSRLADLDGVPRLAWGAGVAPAQDAGVAEPVRGAWGVESGQGGFTSQAAGKRHNRRACELLVEAEWLSVVAMVRAGRAYPGGEMRRLWQEALHLQAREWLDGGLSGGAQREGARRQADLWREAAQERDGAVGALMESGTSGAVSVVNSLWFDRFEVMQRPGAAAPEVVFAPAFGVSAWEAVPSTATPVAMTETAEAFTLENAFVAATLSRGGALVRWRDKRSQRELLPADQAGNRLTLAEDDPGEDEARGWDPLLGWRRSPVAPATAATVVERGPLRVTLEFEFRLSERSTLRQRVTLTALSPRLEFDTAADWWEERRCLQVEFPVETAAESVTVEVPFGQERRPLDGAEVVALRWADLSGPGCGVALLNDSKHGMSAEPRLLRLTLLRAPKSPDPDCDLGRHRFRYAVLPHAGDWRAGRVVEEAASFNQPFTLAAGTVAKGAGASLFSVDHPAIVIESVKRAESSGAVIVRVWEAFGAAARCRLRSGLAVKRVQSADLLEEPGAELAWSEGGVDVTFRPHEVRTLRFELAERAG